jgi:chromosome segregation ATPase
VQAQFEHELNLKQQTSENLERQLNEAKERLQSAEFSKHSSFEKQVEHFEVQRVELNARIDRLMSENLEKDKQIASMTHKLDRNTDTLTRKTQDLDSVRD